MEQGIVRFVLACGVAFAIASPAWAEAPAKGSSKADNPARAALKTLAEKTRGPGAWKDVEAHIAYGRALIEARDLDAAEKALSRAGKVLKDSPEAMYEEARVKFARGDYRRSRGACSQLEKAHRGHVLGAVCWARAFLVWRRASRAEEHLQEALKLDADHPEVQLVLADVRRVGGQWAEARAAYQGYLKKRPDGVEAELGLGRMCLSNGKHDEALVHLRRALEVAPYSVEAMFYVGSNSEGSEAVELLSRVVKMDGSYPEGHAELGRALFAVGDHPRAEKHFMKALEQNPRDARAHIGVGLARVEQGRLAEAEENLKLGLQERPDYADANEALAALYVKSERYEEAFEQFRQVAGKRSGDPTPLVEAARVALSISRSVLAEAFLKNAFERTPELAEAHVLMGDILARRGDARGARERYEQALAGKGKVDRAAINAKMAKLR